MAKDDVQVSAQPAAANDGAAQEKTATDAPPADATATAAAATAKTPGMSNFFVSRRVGV
jgi:hypothetical protein